MEYIVTGKNQYFSFTCNTVKHTNLLNNVNLYLGTYMLMYAVYS